MMVEELMAAMSSLLPADDIGMCPLTYIIATDILSPHPGIPLFVVSYRIESDEYREYPRGA